MKNIAAGFMKKRAAPKLRHQGLLLTRMGEMLLQGFSMAEALNFMGRMHTQWKDMFLSMESSMKNGQAVHDAFYQQGFDRKTCSQLYFAEKHGFLAKSLTESGQYLIERNKQHSKLYRLLQYPLILIIVFIVVGILLQTLLLPRFQLFYDSMGYSPSFLLKGFLQLMEHFPLIVLSLSGLSGIFSLFGFTVLSKMSPVEKAMLYAGLPLFNSYYRLYQTSFLAREWSFLLKSGFSMNEIIEIMIRQEFDPLLKAAAEEIRGLLKVGYSFSEAVEHLGFLQEELSLIISHGEKNGKLDRELFLYSEICTQRLEEEIMKIFSLLQPIIFALIGFMVIAVYLSIFLPMFQVIDSI